MTILYATSAMKRVRNTLLWIIHRQYVSLFPLYNLTPNNHKYKIYIDKMEYRSMTKAQKRKKVN